MLIIVYDLPKNDRKFNALIDIAKTVLFCTGIERGYSECEPFLLHIFKSCSLHFIEKSFSFVELLNRLRKVIIGLLMPGDHFTKSGKDVFEIGIVDVPEWK